MPGWIRTIRTVLTAGRAHEHLERYQSTGFRVSTQHPTAVQLDGDAVGEHRKLECQLRPAVLPVRVLTADA